MTCYTDKRTDQWYRCVDPAIDPTLGVYELWEWRAYCGHTFGFTLPLTERDDGAFVDASGNVVLKPCSLGCDCSYSQLEREAYQRAEDEFVAWFLSGA